MHSINPTCSGTIQGHSCCAVILGLPGCCSESKGRTRATLRDSWLASHNSRFCDAIASLNRQFWPSSYHCFTFPWRLPNTILDYFYTMYDSKDLPFECAFLYLANFVANWGTQNFPLFPEIRNDFWRVWPSRSWISDIIPESLSVGGWVVLKIFYLVLLVPLFRASADNNLCQLAASLPVILHAQYNPTCSGTIQGHSCGTIQGHSCCAVILGCLAVVQNPKGGRAQRCAILG